MCKGANALLEGRIIFLILCKKQITINLLYEKKTWDKGLKSWITYDHAHVVHGAFY